MTKTKHYLLALISVVVIYTVWSWLNDLLQPLLFSPKSPASIAEAYAWAREVFFWSNISWSAQTFVAFGVAAYLLRQGAMLPGLALWLALSLLSLYVLKIVAATVDPTITYFEVIAQNPAGWVASIISTILGILVGERIARARPSERHAL